MCYEGTHAFKSLNFVIVYLSHNKNGEYKELFAKTLQNCRQLNQRSEHDLFRRVNGSIFLCINASIKLFSST
jgi:hypothetical protein